jgi:amphiphysin
MSFRGLQKSVVRAPQQFRAKFNIGDHTADNVYTDAERRFQELEKETKQLHDESKRYFESINSMLQHQIEFSQAMTEIYKPISGRMSDPDSLVPAGNFEGIQACEEYEAIVKDLRETLQPELEMIEARIVRPANELMDVIKVIRKTIVKRDHKRLDYDRHRGSLKKLQDKKDRSAKDEKAMWKAEGDVETATQDFNYFNDLLKDELPKLFRLEQDFIKPLFQSFYYMQLNIFYTMHSKMQGCDIGYFDLTMEIEEAFERKRGDVQERAEALSIVKFKTTGQRRPPKYQRPNAIEAGPSQKLIGAGSSSAAAGKPPPPPSPGAPLKALPPPSPNPATKPPPPPSPAAPRVAFAPSKAAEAAASAAAPVSPGPPPYSPMKPAPPPPVSAPAAPTPPGPSVLQPAASIANSSSLAAAIAAKKAKPPPPVPKPKPKHLEAAKAVETVTALYDYEAQADGDLSFKASDVIEIVTRTDNDNEWWTGRLNGREGQFPGNYVQRNQ